MEALIGTFLGYLISNIKKSKGAQQAGGELSEAIWKWVRPIFLKEDKESETLQDLKANPDDKDNQEMAASEIKRYLKKKPEEEQTLAALLERLQASDLQPAATHITQIHYGSGDNVGRDKIVKG